MSAASCNKWWLDDIIKGTGDYAKEQEGITTMRCLAAIMYFYLPYLMGERSPHNNPLASGSTFTGMTMDTTRYRYDTGCI